MTTTESTSDDAATSPGQPEAQLDSRYRALAEDVRWFLGSPLGGVFGGLALDQVAYRRIAAAVDRSGRFADNFTDRGIRSFAFTALMAFGDPADREAFRGDLKRLHADVKGTGRGEFADDRYSALAPELWVWVAVSSLHVFYLAYLYVCGRRLDEQEKQVVYRTMRAEMSYLELPSRAGKLPETVREMRDYYDRVAATELADNEFLQFARRNFTAPPPPKILIPPGLHPALMPIWRPLVKLAARPTIVCSDTVAHPRMRELFGVRTSPRDRLEFAAYVTILRLAWRLLPRRLTLEPLAYNRYRYERIRRRYRSVLLDSFAAP
ncbi:oxygenase MpaB family protein [Nocardia vaccinii]|uniref:oxygenase MpaB family protein n=1 Tax=Nocardia vaccinii TaxID=1822 RepID=UPI000830D390|nr:oxygenase MpaB family protein [Nocardia vaccinii]